MTIIFRGRQMSFLDRLNKVNWIADVLSPLAVIMTEVFWLYPWLIVIGKLPTLAVQRTPLSLLSVIFIIGIAFITTRLFLSRKWSLLWIQLSIMVCGLTVIFLVVCVEYSAGFRLLSGQWFTFYGNALLNTFSQQHPFLFAIIAGFFLWWRGLNISRSSLYFTRIYTSFLIEMATLVILIIMWGFLFKTEPFQNLTAEVGIYVAGFFFFGLVSMALSNLRIIQERMRAKGEPSKTFGRRWLSIIISIIGGIILIGISLASLFSTQFISSLGKILSVFSDVLYKIVYYLLVPIGYLVQWLYYAGKYILNWFIRGETLEPFEAQQLGDPDKLPEVTKGAISPEIMVVIKWSILAIFFIVVILLITRAIVRRRSARAQDEIEEEQESLWSWEGFKSDLLIFFKMFFNRFKKKTGSVSETSVSEWQPDEDTERRLSIREIYQHLLWQTARLRIPRENYETPFEYAGRLSRFVPDGREPLNEITKLYVNVRYGEREVEDKKVDDANNIWKILRNILQSPRTN